MDDLPKANPTLRAVLIGVGIVLLLLLLTPFGLCAHHCYRAGKKREREKKAEIVHTCQSECIRANLEVIGPCDAQNEAASKALETKSKKRYAPLERRIEEGIRGGLDKIGKLRKGLREGNASPDAQTRITALYKTVLQLQDDEIKLSQKKRNDWLRVSGELWNKRLACQLGRLVACRARCEKK